MECTVSEAPLGSVAAPADRLDEVVRSITEVSTLPQVALEVMRIANDPGSDAADLRRVVENDPSLAARIIRLVNSAAYAARTPVTNLQQAISFLGFSQVRNLAVTATVSELFRSDGLVGPYRRTALWKHLVTVGICARMVACRCELPQFDDVFLAGLLHDIGIMLEDQYDHDNFRALLENLTDDVPLETAERAALGYAHTELGEALAVAWRFPPATRAAIRHHHASHLYQGAGATTVACVEVANAVCTIKGVPSVGRKLLRAPIEALRALKFTPDDIRVLASDLDREVRQSQALFEL